jgi:hypothetical protein
VRSAAAITRLRLFALLIGFLLLPASSLLAQTSASPNPLSNLNPFIFLRSSGVTVTGGVTYQQVRYNDSCSSGTSSCTVDTFPTVPGSVWAVQAFLPSDNLTIASATSSGGNFSLCPGSECHTYLGGFGNQDFAVNATGSSGTNSVTVNLSGNATTGWGLVFYEALGPNCNGSPCAGALDNANATDNGGVTCQVCTGAAPSVSSTDWVLHSGNYNTGQGVFPWSSPYLTDWFEDGQGFDITTSTPPTFNQVGTGFQFQDVGLAFKFPSAGNYTPPTKIFSLVQAPGNTSFNCSSTCAITVPSTGSSNLLWMEFSSNDSNGVSPPTSSGYISAVTGACSGSWAVPTGTQEFNPSAGSVSMAYCLSSSSGGTTLNVTVTAPGNYWWNYVEEHRSVGSFSLDAASVGAAYNGTATTQPSGISGALSGPDELCFQGIEALTGQFLSQSLYWQPPYNGGGNNANPTWGSTAELPDTANGSAPLWQDTTSETSVVDRECFE